MSEAQNRKYWCKLNKNFMDYHKIKRLMKSTGLIRDGMGEIERRGIEGCAMMGIYLQLLAESCSHCGRLRYDNDEKYDILGLAEVVGVEEITMATAVKRLKELGLLKELEDGTIYFSQMETMLGSESESAERMRRMRSNPRIEDDNDEQDGDPPPPQDTPQEGQPQVLVKSWNPSKADLGQFYGSAMLPEAHKEEFIAYCLETRCMAANVRPSRPAYIINLKYRDWLQSRGAKPIEYAELQAAVVEMNKNRKSGMITEAQMGQFWDSIKDDGFKNYKGEVISVHNVKRTLNLWLENRSRFGKGGKQGGASSAVVTSATAAPLPDRVVKILANECKIENPGELPPEVAGCLRDNYEQLKRELESYESKAAPECKALLRKDYSARMERVVKNTIEKWRDGEPLR